MTAIVPMRHSSERVPGKNYRPLGGLPLYQHVVTTLLATPGVGEVVIDTDSETILEEAARVFPSVTLVERPAHLRDGHTPMNAVLEHSIGHAHYEAILQTHSTNPFVRAETFEAAIRRFFDSEGIDSVFGATRIQGRLWTEDLTAVNHDPAVLARTQDLAPIYLENSCFYVFSKATLRDGGNRLGKSPAIVEVDALEATDIDVETEFRLAEIIEASQLFGVR
ncbi:acylneuraminate cytidylyltransferase family protein [Nocardioides psychrotolerans]|uniref:acylneuraminate cytidylyltransferase family protein n=1 Tax=Nocardioides psychrotolerans TaxID=1005945 RepID=UPI001C3FE172|nr:acylneuraminate cytidylyltransferase family protein [Nocardioides psychrotolerans]